MIVDSLEEPMQENHEALEEILIGYGMPPSMTEEKQHDDQREFY